MSGECITCGASATGERCDACERANAILQFRLECPEGMCMPGAPCEACAYVATWDSCSGCDGRGRWVRYRGPMREESGLCEECEGTGLVLVELFGKDAVNAIRASH